MRSFAQLGHYYRNATHPGDSSQLVKESPETSLTAQ
jgi:hypothetical protein